MTEVPRDSEIPKIKLYSKQWGGFPWSWVSEESAGNPGDFPSMQETWVRFVGWEDPLEKAMATHSTVLAWRIPRMEEPGGLQSTGSPELDPNWQLNHYQTMGWLHVTDNNSLSAGKPPSARGGRARLVLPISGLSSRLRRMRKGFRYPWWRSSKSVSANFWCRISARPCCCWLKKKKATH